MGGGDDDLLDLLNEEKQIKSMSEQERKDFELALRLQKENNNNGDMGGSYDDLAGGSGDNRQEEEPVKNTLILEATESQDPETMKLVK